MSLYTILQDTTNLTGGISSQQVANMRAAMIADNKIDDLEAGFLFSLKSNYDGRDNAPEWAVFWVEALLLYLYRGGSEIDANRLLWVKNRIAADGVVDTMEQQLLDAIPNTIV